MCSVKINENNGFIEVHTQGGTWFEFSVQKTTHGLSSAASATVHVVKKATKPVYEHALKPVGEAIGKKAGKYEKKAEDFLDASINTVVGTQ